MSTARSHPEVLAEVYLADVGIVHDVVRMTLGHDPAVIDDDEGPVADAQRFPDVVIGDQHADAPVFEGSG